MNRLFKILLAWLACLQLCGGPLGLLQGVAWAKMLVSYSQQDGVVEGVKKTFDGDHPCAMCRAIASAKANETERPADTSPTLDMGKLAKTFSLWTEPVAVRHGVFDLYVLQRAVPPAVDGCDSAAPPTPPPRWV